MDGDYFYEGADYGFDPEYGGFSQAYSSSLSKNISLATDPRVANQLKAASDKLNTGATAIELSFVSPDVFETIPKQHFEELNRLRKVVGKNVELTLHAPLVEPSGLVKRGWDSYEREQAERQMIDAITKAHKLNPEGNVVTTFHASVAGAPAETIIWEEKMVEGEKRKVPVVKEAYVMNETTGDVATISLKPSYFEGEEEKAIKKAQKSDKPALIITDTHIGYGSPNKQDTSHAHGSPLGDAEVAAAKKNLDWPDDKTFYVPEEVTEYFAKVKSAGKRAEAKWNKLFKEYSEKYPEDAALFTKVMNHDFGDEWKSVLPKFEKYGEKQATRNSSENVINAIAAKLPTLFGGSADLAASTNTKMKSDKDFSVTNRTDRNINFGIREFGMAAMLNGMYLYGGVIPYGATFMVFADYLRPAIRLASISHIKPIYVFTHDSIGLGEDGPTHQPVEHLASLRAIPGLVVIRPADANETSYAWKAALEHKGGPVAIALTRQKINIIDRNKYASAEGLEKGAYIIKDSEGKPDVILLASGSEVDMTIKAAEKLDGEGIKARVVSFPSWELFEAQSAEYKESVLPKDVKARLSIEPGVKQGWEKYIGDYGDCLSIEGFGASAPLEVIFDKYGFSVDNIIAKAKGLLNQ